MKKNFHTVIAVLAMLTPPMAVQAQGYDYESIDLPSSSITQVWGINGRGNIVGNGFLNTGASPFVYDSRTGIFTSIAPVAGFSDTILLGIADNDDTVGAVLDPSGSEHGLILDRNGNVTVFTHPDADNATHGRGINERGVVTGFRDDADPNIFLVGFVHDPSTGSFTDIPGGFLTIAQGINARGDVVGNSIFGGDDPCASGTGRYGWLRTAKGEQTYFTVNGLRTTARGISDAGTITGFVLDPTTGNLKGFVTKIDRVNCENITIDEADLLEFPGADWTIPQDISNSGTVVGQWTDDQGIFHGFVATPQ